MSETTELTLPQRAAVALKSSQHEAELLALASKYADITEIVNGAGRDQAHGAMMELANRRVAITKAGKDARDDATKFSKAIIEEERRLVSLIEPEEGRLRGLRDAWDQEREREKQAKAAAEKARVDGIRKRIAEIQAIPAMLVGKQSETIAAAIESLEAVTVTLEDFSEFAGEAEMVKIAAVAKLGEMLTAQLAAEAEAKRLQEERAELERLRAEQAERERAAAAERAEQERVARVAREAEEARLRAEREAHEAELRRQREAEEAKLAEQREELARQQAEIDKQREEAARIERERLAAIEREEQRKREEVAAAAQKAERERIARENAEHLAARHAPEPTGGTWSIGKTWGAIVTDAEIAGSPGSGHNDTEYYGGNLICESVWRPADARLIAAAPDLLKALRAMVHKATKQNWNDAYPEQLQQAFDAIEKATYTPQPEAQAA